MWLIRPSEITEPKLISSSVPETVALWNSGATYAKDQEARVGHEIYKSAAAGNLNHPIPDPAWWLGPKPSNRWAAFDGVNTTVTTADEIDFTVRPGELVDSIALLDVSATSVRITAVSDANGTVYDRTFTLSNVITESDFYVWFFEPIKRSKVLVTRDLPLMADLEVSVDLDGENQRLATFVVGSSWMLGSAIYGAEIGIDDYSKYIENGFGDEVLIPGAYSKRGSFTVFCEPELGDANADLLAQYRATNLVWIASEQFNATVIFGYAKSWKAQIAYPTLWSYSLDIKGRT